MRLRTAVILLAISFSLSATEPPGAEAQSYRIKTYDESCRLLATGMLDLRIEPPDDNGVRRVTGDRLFELQVNDASPFGPIPGELIGSIEGDEIRLNLDRNVFDGNTHVSGQMIDTPEPGFEGTWNFVGWGGGPSGRIIAARAPAVPTKPCEDLPEPVTRGDMEDDMFELIRSMEQGLKSLPERPQKPSSDHGRGEDSDANEDKTKRLDPSP